MRGLDRHAVSCPGMPLFLTGPSSGGPSVRLTCEWHALSLPAAAGARLRLLDASGDAVLIENTGDAGDSLDRAEKACPFSGSARLPQPLLRQAIPLSCAPFLTPQRCWWSQSRTRASTPSPASWHKARYARVPGLACMAPTTLSSHPRCPSREPSVCSADWRDWRRHPPVCRGTAGKHHAPCADHG